MQLLTARCPGRFCFQQKNFVPCVNCCHRLLKETHSACKGASAAGRCFCCSCVGRVQLQQLCLCCSHLRENLPLPLGPLLLRSSWYVARTATALRLLGAAAAKHAKGSKKQASVVQSRHLSTLGVKITDHQRSTCEEHSCSSRPYGCCQAPTTGGTLATAVCNASHRQLFTLRDNKC